MMESLKELTKRLELLKNNKQLAFSCYRIRRNWSLALPLTSLPNLELQIRGFSQPYPWQIWCLWALEERLYVLGGAGTFLKDQEARELSVRDLEALAQWPQYTVANKLDLPYGHAVNLMTIALRDWTWLPESTQQTLRQALHRAVDEGVLLVPLAVQELASVEDLLSKSSPHHHLHNIPLIAQAALASAAEVISHPKRDELSKRFLLLLQARLDLYYQGLTEGISYDGYLYNFALGWLSTQSKSIIERIAHHPAMLDLEKQAYGLACPGHVAKSAEVGDVEPVEMPFVWSALIRLQQWVFSETREALLHAVPVEWLRADALWLCLQQHKQQLSLDHNYLTSFEESVRREELTVPLVQQNTVAVTLATGLMKSDLSVVVSLCQSPMNHIQADTGNLLIGHAGYWWITDSGYQQYLKTSEREFTLGPQAHNTPVINGYGQSYKVGQLLYAGDAYVVVDLTSCYPESAQVETVIRTLWRIGREQVVVCDTVVAVSEAWVAYHWHADAEAYWGEHSGAVSLYLPSAGRVMWIQSGQQSLSLAQQHRLRGSRGQGTLQTTQPSSVTHHWWCFSFAETPTEFQASGLRARLGTAYLSLEDLLPKELPTSQLKVVVQRDFLQIGVYVGDELLALSVQSDRVVTLSVNEEEAYSQKIQGRQCRIPIPTIGAKDIVVITAKSLNAGADTLETLSYILTAEEKTAICSVPLRVYAEANANQVTGRCAFMPAAIEGDVEYAFYLLVDGVKSQVQWYQRSEMHTFTLTQEELAKNVQIRGFVRSVISPTQKMSATSLALRANSSNN